MAVREGFFGDQCTARAGIQRFGECIGIAASNGYTGVLLQDFGNHIGVAAERRQDKDALLHGVTAATCR